MYDTYNVYVVLCAQRLARLLGTHCMCKTYSSSSMWKTYSSSSSMCKTYSSSSSIDQEVNVYDTYNCVCCAVCLRPTFYTVYV